MLSRSGSPLPWVEAAKGVPYFVTDRGEPWTPIGQNDAITWPDLTGCYRCADLAAVELYMRRLATHGVTCLRLMLEYCEGDQRYLEKPAGVFQPHMVRLWDDLFLLAGRYGLRILLTPYDTFWMWNRWRRHPYNTANGGPCPDRSRLLLCPKTREAIKARLAFAAERWGGSGALFAWDLWNEIHPSQAENTAAIFADFVEDVSKSLRALEYRLYGRTHPQTVSVFGPHMVLDSRITDTIFRHPCLDFASTHFYEEGTIDFPRNTVDAALSTGKLMRDALAEIRDSRPFFDSEHGPIHTYKDHKITLPQPFDDEYFRHMQWAHFASGGAGGGMRWPNRKPHCLTRGMRIAQRGLAGFLPLIDWQHFRRRNLNSEVTVSNPSLAVCACGDAKQAIVWLLRKDALARDGRLDRRAPPVTAAVEVPGLGPGTYRITAWDTASGTVRSERHQTASGAFRFETLPITTDCAFAIQLLPLS